MFKQGYCTKLWISEAELKSLKILIKIVNVCLWSTRLLTTFTDLVCAMGEELWLAPDCRQGRTASLLCLSTPGASWRGLPARLDGRSAGGQLTERRRFCYPGLGPFLQPTVRRVKRAFEHTSPHSQCGAMGNRLRWSSEVTQVDRQHPQGEAKSRLWFCSHGIHKYSFIWDLSSVGLNSSLTL